MSGHFQALADFRSNSVQKIILRFVDISVNYKHILHSFKRKLEISAVTANDLPEVSLDRQINVAKRLAIPT
jgi:hypothetical protein